MAAAIFASVTEASFSRCLDEEDVRMVREDTTNFSMSWYMSLDPGDSCYHETHAAAYIYWRDDMEIEVRTATYRPPREDESKCEELENNIPYENSKVLYTMNDEWPHTDKDICAHLWIITNLNKE